VCVSASGAKLSPAMHVTQVSSRVGRVTKQRSYVMSHSFICTHHFTYTQPEVNLELTCLEFPPAMSVPVCCSQWVTSPLPLVDGVTSSSTHNAEASTGGVLDGALAVVSSMSLHTRTAKPYTTEGLVRD
jgi:hypothetical protein